MAPSLMPSIWYETHIIGFGHIGRLVMHIVTTRDDIEAVSVNDPFIDAKYMVGNWESLLFLFT